MVEINDRTVKIRDEITSSWSRDSSFTEKGERKTTEVRLAEMPAK